MMGFPGALAIQAMVRSHAMRESPPENDSAGMHDS